MSEFLAPVDYLPHEAPMCLLESVFDVDEESAWCRVSVSSGGVLAPFLDEEGNLPGWFAIEIIAQTVGVWSGWHNRRQHKEKAQIGMLLGGRGINCLAPVFPAGALLDCRVSLLMRDDKIGSFDGQIMHGERLLASGRINTYQPDNQELKQLFQQDGME